ncbi:MAG: SusD/RagB family nutrient-binding outer membrane lipoprotein [Gemmatimonadetes bacterium]|nr:SusD/RagB family nutrient-binding outer membrane lipoprotein [Gemmatimonadota bacterium]
MKKTTIALLVGSVGLLGGCENFLDVNTNPNAPQEVAANLYLPPMLHWMVTTQHWDGRATAAYTQQLTFQTQTVWDRMGYAPGSDFAGEQWRTVYWVFGQNLVDMMEIAERERRWDILGVGYILKAWGWQAATGLSGEIIVREAFDQTKFDFNYDDQQFVYQEVNRLLDSAVVYLERTEGAVSAPYLARGDHIYNGDRTKWLKFAHGLRAINLSHFTNKASYDPAAVIAAVDRSFQSNADDALLTFPNTQNNDRNFIGRSRGNFTNYRQTQFVVGLMDGTVFGAEDPRMTRMLSPAPDGQYRGLDPNLFNALTSLPENQRPNNPHGYPGAGGLQQPGLYVFADEARMPAMTYAQLQFVKAEAAYRMGDMGTALQAYREGISAHIDFVNARNRDDNQWPTAITAAEKAEFLADPGIVPIDAGNLTLTQIMSQKYIAQWAWAFNEQWMDMRRYRYTDIDPASGQQVYPGFTPPMNLYPDNAGKLVYRLRPRYNSEYVWNQDGLRPIGGLELDYHTKPLWIIEP